MSRPRARPTPADRPAHIVLPTVSTMRPSRAAAAAALGFVVLSIVVPVTIDAVLSRIRQRPAQLDAVWIIIIALASLLAAMVICVVSAQRKTLALRQAAAATRRARLTRLLGCPDPAAASPCRRLEAALLEHFCSRANESPWWDVKNMRRALRGVLPDLPPGFTASISGRGAGRGPRPVRLADPFEPLESNDHVAFHALREHARALTEPAKAAAPDSPPPALLTGGAAAKEHVRAKRRLPSLGQVLRGLWALLMLLGFCGLFVFLAIKIIGLLVRMLIAGYDSLARGDVAIPLVVLALLAATAGPVLIPRIILGRRTLLVPGGLVHIRQPFWRKTGSALYARRATTPLVWNLTDQAAYVWSGGRIWRIPFDSFALDAWFAAPAPPSVEAIQALLGEETELTVAACDEHPQDGEGGKEREKE